MQVISLLKQTLTVFPDNFKSKAIRRNLMGIWVLFFIFTARNKKSD
jgi:hypothetical protein